MLSLVFAMLIFILTFPLLTFLVIYHGRVYPGVYIDTINVSGLTINEASSLLTSQKKFSDTINIRLTSGSSKKDFTVPTKAFGAVFEYDKATSDAFNVGRSGRTLTDIANLVLSLIKSKKVPLTIYINQSALYEQISIIAAQIDDPPEKPELYLSDGEVFLTEASGGYTLDISKAEMQLSSAIKKGQSSVNIVADYNDSALSEEEQALLITRANKLKSKSLKLSFEEHTFNYKQDKLLSLLRVNNFSLDNIDPSIEDIKRTIERSPTNPLFNFLPPEAGEENHVKEFKPAIKGVSVNTGTLMTELTKGLFELESSDLNEIVIEIPVIYTEPEIQTSEVNSLGIKELIGVGTSKFKGSIASRVHNVSLAAARLNGILIKPGEVFSFNKALGDISVYSGYKQAYIIQGNETVLGDGGGVCQVSTTFFRAALAAGLPIVERHPHSYRVGYYEQDSGPGIDATIYSPTVDIKIKNDTPAHILIQTFADAKNMTLKFEFYGTSDGRVATISKPVVSQVTPPRDDLYMDDPTLPTGQIKQVDYKAWGAKVNFSYSVVRNGETIIDDTFYSNYKPWQAKYLRGTGPTN